MVECYHSTISSVEKKEEAKAKHEENIIAEEVLKGKVQEELNFQEMKLQIKSKEYQKTDKIVNEERVNVKLRKLIITKFNGKSLDWFCFESKINKTEIGAMSKFSYLKDFLILRLGLLIDDLPFTSEGCSRTKSILRSKFGKLTEIAAAHIQCITLLPVIQNSHSNRIHENR